MAWTERDIPDGSDRMTDAWLATLGTESADASHEDVLAALDAVRDEPETRLGHSTEEE